MMGLVAILLKGVYSFLSDSTDQMEELGCGLGWQSSKHYLISKLKY